MSRNVFILGARASKENEKRTINWKTGSSFLNFTASVTFIERTRYKKIKHQIKY